MSTISNNASCQRYQKKLHKLLVKAQNEFSSGNFAAALEAVNNGLLVDSTFIPARLLKADMLFAMGNVCDAAQFNERTCMMDSLNVKLYLVVGGQYLKCGNYEKASRALEIFKKKSPNANLIKIADSLLNLTACARQLKNKKLHVSDFSYLTSVNTKNDEYVNSMSANGKYLLFTRHVVSDDNIVKENIFVAQTSTTAGQHDSIFPLEHIVELHGNEGAVTFSPDGYTMYFAVCNGHDGYGSCDLYYSRQVKNHKWSKPINIGSSVNTKYWESQPCMSPDGRTLFFVSNRPGGKGKSDIWFTTLQENGTFTQPANCGEDINSMYDEFAPFMHFDGVSLYFSSNRPCGLGGLDLYMVTINANVLFSQRYDTMKIVGNVVNLGYPVNDASDQMNFIINPQGDKAFISTKHFDSIMFDSYDIVSFDMPTEVKPAKTTCLCGVVSDKDNAQHISGAVVQIVDKTAGKETITITTDDNGAFTACLIDEHDYGITVSARDYLLFSDDVSPVADTMKVLLEHLSKGDAFVMRNIEFAYDSYKLLPVSYAELDRTVQLITLHNNLKFKVVGYTDNIGNEEYNRQLSEKRAKAVYDYFISKGVPAEILSYEGKGMQNPIETNDNEEGRAKNRRTEIVVE